MENRGKEEERQGTEEEGKEKEEGTLPRGRRARKNSSDRQGRMPGHAPPVRREARAEWALRREMGVVWRVSVFDLTTCGLLRRNGAHDVRLGALRVLAPALEF